MYEIVSKEKKKDKKTVQKKSDTYIPAQLGDVIQRNVYWPVDANGRVGANNAPVAAIPANGNYIDRAGNGLNQRLYDDEETVRNAAKIDAGWNAANGMSKRDQAGANQAGSGAGRYYYNREEVEAEGVPVDTLAMNTPLVAMHNRDTNAELERFQNSVMTHIAIPARHFHAATMNNGAAEARNIRGKNVVGPQPDYNQIGADHYFINPFI